MCLQELSHKMSGAVEIFFGNYRLFLNIKELLDVLRQVDQPTNVRIKRSRYQNPDGHEIKRIQIIHKLARISNLLL